MRSVDCEGWWEQNAFGVQPMEELRLEFSDGSIVGTGIDIIGPFRFMGVLDQGKVTMTKRYLGRHSVDYLGTYDGEGTMEGTWHISPLTGRWAIRIIPPGRAGSERTATLEQIKPH